MRNSPIIWKFDKYQQKLLLQKKLSKSEKEKEEIQEKLNELRELYMKMLLDSLKP